MILPAPAILAALTAARPIPPQPITAHRLARGHVRRVNTAPAPVVTAQPISAARSSGMSRSIATQAFSCTSICSAKADRLRICASGLSPVGQARRARSLARRVDGIDAQRRVAGDAELAAAAEHREAGHDVIADLDGRDIAADPASTTPAASCPGMVGIACG